MKRLVRPVLVLLALCGVFTVVYAAAPTGTEKTETHGNAYYLYTKDLHVDDSGVAAIPPRFNWSVETSWRGIDSKGEDLPDTRVMLRLYDPDHNSTALTAQMNLATASKLHRELGAIIAKKVKDSDYRFRPQLYSSEKIPTGRIVGVDEHGVAIIELTYPGSNRTEILRGPTPASGSSQ